MSRLGEGIVLETDRSLLRAIGADAGLCVVWVRPVARVDRPVDQLAVVVLFERREQFAVVGSEGGRKYVGALPMIFRISLSRRWISLLRSSSLVPANVRSLCEKPCEAIWCPLLYAFLTMAANSGLSIRP